MKFIINNWDEYMYRKDMKSLSWFRVNSDIMFHPKFHKIPPDAGWLFICLLGFAAKKVSATIELPDDYLVDVTGCDIHKCAKVLNENGLVRICTDSYGSVANTTLHYTTLHNTTQQNTTGRVNTLPPPSRKSSSKAAKFDAENLAEVVAKLPKSKMPSLLKLYGNDKNFIERELLKAWNYYAVDNTRKKPKSSRGWSQAISYWLEKAWVQKAKNTSGNKKNISFEERRSQNNAALWERVAKGEFDE